MSITTNSVGSKASGVRNPGVLRAAVGCALTSLLLILWALTHEYRGFDRDGQLYAFQALAKLRPWLRSDLYLQNTSQDNFTVFSSLYACFIKLLGLQSAEMLLFTMCTAGFLLAAWVLIRRLSDPGQAFLAVALLIATAGHFGASEIFSYSENYLTARSLGEVLVVTALACHFQGQRVIAWTIGAASLVVHPLMVLPGTLLLACQWLKLRSALMLAAAGVAAALLASLAASLVPGYFPLLKLMDPAWLDVVRERSQFLFLRYWDWSDWENTVRPFVSLTLTLLVVEDARISKLCITAMLVGVCGIAVAAIADYVGPLAILVQGQSWRWLWITTFISVVLLVPTMMRLWRLDACGPLVATLLLMGWTYDPVDGLACVDGALLLWLIRDRIPDSVDRYMSWILGALGAVILAWTAANCWTYFHTSLLESGREPLLVSRLRQCFGLGMSGLILAWTIAFGVAKIRHVWAACAACLGLIAAAAWVLPGSMKQLDDFDSEAEHQAFAEWRAAIPPSSNVLLVPSGASSLLQWFTLERSAYLSLAESAGVVFSRATAAEVLRRSTVLLPLEDPDWKILTSIRNGSLDAPAQPSSAGANLRPKPLTADALKHVCADNQLDFVISRDNVGFEPLRHQQPGKFKDWFLYSCSVVRATGRVG